MFALVAESLALHVLLNFKSLAATATRLDDLLEPRTKREALVELF